jgi:hypothetical protein
LIINNWDEYQASKEVIAQHLAKHGKSVLLTGAIAQRIKNALLSFDKDALGANNRAIYDAIDKWLTENRTRDNIEDLFKVFTIQLQSGGIIGALSAL